MHSLKACVYTISIVLAWSFLTPATGADVHTGRSLWRAYDSRQTGADTITRAASFDERGIVYGANESGLLSFDGARWRLSPAGPAVAPIHTILYMGNGTWLAGGPKTLGVFAPSAQGAHVWQADKDADDEALPFEDTVLSLVQHNDTVYVVTDREVFVRNNGTLTSVFEGALTGFSFTVGDAFMVATEDNVLRISESKSTDISVPASWNTLQPIAHLSDIDEQTIIATHRSGLFRVTLGEDALNLSPLWEILPTALESEDITAAQRHIDGSFVFGTAKGAIIHLSRTGETLRSLDPQNGFHAGSVRTLLTDDAGNLIAFFDGGAVWLDLTDTLSVWDSVNGLPGSVTALTMDNESVFAGTNLGVFRSASGSRMRQIPEIGPSPVLTLNTFKRSNITGHTSLLIGREDGLYDYFDRQIRAITTSRPHAVFVSRTQPTRIAVGLKNSISLFEFDLGDWIDLGTLGPETSHAVSDITETSEGDLLVALADSSVLRFVADDWLRETRLAEVAAANTQTFSRKQRQNARPILATHADNIHLLLPQSGLKWNLRTQRFEADAELATEVSRFSGTAKPTWHSAAKDDAFLWLQSHDKSFVLEDSAARLTQLPDLTNGTYQFSSILVDKAHQRVLFATPSGLVSIADDWVERSQQQTELPSLVLRGVSLDGRRTYAGEGLKPTLTVDSQNSEITLDLALLNWSAPCDDGDYSLDILKSGQVLKTRQMNSRCTAIVSGDDLGGVNGILELRLTRLNKPASKTIEINVEIGTPWYLKSYLPAALAIVFAMLSIIGGHRARRVWPEPLRRYLALLSGLALCLALTITLNSVQLISDFESLVMWVSGLLVVAFLLPVFAEIIMRLGERRSNAIY